MLGDGPGEGNWDPKTAPINCLKLHPTVPCRSFSFQRSQASKPTQDLDAGSKKLVGCDRKTYVDDY